MAILYNVTVIHVYGIKSIHKIEILGWITGSVIFMGSCCIHYWDLKWEFLNKQYAEDSSETLNCSIQLMPEAFVIKDSKGKIVL